MKPRLLAFLSAVLLFASFALGAKDRVPSFEERQAEHAMKRFMQACMSTFGTPSGLRDVVEKAGLRPLQRDAAAIFLRGGEGDVWTEQNEFGSFAVAASGDGVCSIFSRKIDADLLQAALVSRLPAQGSGLTSTEVLSKYGLDDVKTVGYSIFRDGQPLALWVLSTSKLEDAGFQGVISMQKN